MMKRMDILKLSGVMLFAFTMMWSTALANIGLVFVILSACIAYKDCWQSVKTQPLFYVSVAFVVYVIFRQTVMFVYPEGDGLREITPWLYLSLFWLVGWGLGENQKHWQWFLILAFIGFWIRVVNGFELEGVKAALFEGASFGFNLKRASILFALNVATVILAWIVWRRQIINLVASKKFIGWGVWLTLMILAFEVLVITNSRGTWLSLLVALAVLAGLNLANKGITWKRAALLLTLFGILVIANLNTVMDRVESESASYQAIMTGDLSKVPYTSAGSRVHMYAHGWEMGKLHPWFGWGAGSLPWLMQQTPDKNLYQFNHFHSGYFGVWLQFGLVGVLFFAAVFILLVRALYLGYKRGSIDPTYAHFLLSSMAVMVVWNIFDVGLEHTDFRFYTLFVLGLAFAVISQSGKNTEHA